MRSINNALTRFTNNNSCFRKFQSDRISVILISFFPAATIARSLIWWRRRVNARVVNDICFPKATKTMQIYSVFVLSFTKMFRQNLQRHVAFVFLINLHTRYFLCWFWDVVFIEKLCWLLRKKMWLFIVLYVLILLTIDSFV